MDVELYADDDEVARLEAALLQAPVPAVLVPLAWHLRQRDMERALALAAAADSLLGSTSDHRRARARLILLRAEAAWLQADMQAAETLLAAARAEFQTLDDVIGAGDAALLDSRLAGDLGDGERQRRSLAACADCYAGSSRRHAVALAWGLLDSHTRNAPEPTPALDALLAGDPSLGSGGADALIAACAATEDFRFGRYIAAEAEFGHAGQELMRVGLVRQAILALVTSGLALSNLNLLDRAVLQAERVLVLARPSGWPYCIGMGLRLLGVTEFLLGRQETAKSALLDALGWLAPLRRTSAYVLTALRLAAVRRDLGEVAEALATLEDARQAALDGGNSRLMSEVLAVMARTLSELGRSSEALTLAEEALATAQAISHAQHVNALEALIEIHLHATLPPPPEMATPNAALHYLERLWAIRNEEPGWLAEPRMLANGARAWEQAGDLVKALDFERRSKAALERESTRKANERLAEVRMRHEAETARLEAEQQRRLAASEAARAATSEAASRTLDELGRIGQELTASLDTETVFEALAGHVGALLDAQSLGIWLLDETGKTLVEAFAIEGGERSSGLRVALDNPVSHGARSVRERRELLLEFDSVLADPSHVPGTQEVRSALFAPLIVGDRVLGVLTIQSDTPQAYRERERFIFRTLCAYGAIALDNAAAYRQLGGALAELRATQNRLVQQEKMAALGALVAGISHELNTPLGVVLLSISGLGETTAELRQAIEAGRLTRSSLAGMTEKQAKLAALALQNLERLAALISAFKAVSVQVGEDAAIRLDLPEFLATVAQMAALQLVQQGHRIIVEAAAGLSLETVPDALVETLSRLLANTLDHAFPSGRIGTVTIAARPVPGGQIAITVEDDGVGIEPVVLPKVFDPFFTTKRGTGKNVGLGLHVAFNQVTQRLKGTIQADSTPGAGTRMIVTLPSMSQAE
jgi:signal transduction histidine kinase